MDNLVFLALFKYMLCSHFTQNCILLYFLEEKIFVLWRKIVENPLIFVYLFCPKNSAIDFTKTFITQEWLVAESCPTPHWIGFLMLYRLVYNIRSHFNELILAWSASHKSKCIADLIFIIHQRLGNKEILFILQAFLKFVYKIH